MAYEKQTIMDWKKITLGVVFCIISYFSLFHKLEKEPVRVWDESLFALRATYMMENGQYMSNFNLMSPELANHKNTKMPLMTIVQAVSFKLFGLGELPLRLPLVIIIFLSLLYFIRYSHHHFKEAYIGVITALMLITSGGFNYDHMARFGDHDIVFGCFLFLSVLSFFAYDQSKKPKDIILFGVFMSCALLTKSILAFQFVPGIMVYLVINKRLAIYLKNKWVYIVAAGCLTLFALTFAYLESSFPGFIERTWKYELGGRYSQTIEGHQGSFFYFFQDWLTRFFTPWLLFSILGVALLFKPTLNKRKKQFLQIMICVFTSAYLIFGFSQTKTFWYGAPMYFPMAAITAIGVHELIKSIINQKLPTKIMAFSGLSLCLLIPTINVIKSNILNSNAGKEEQYRFFVEDLKNKQPGLKEFSIVDSNFGTSAFFYTNMYNKEENYKLKYHKGAAYDDGEIVMACLDKVMNPLFEKYEAETLENFHMCKLIKIKGKKSQ